MQRVVARRALRHERAPEEHVQLGMAEGEAGEPECREILKSFENTPRGRGLEFAIRSTLDARVFESRHETRESSRRELFVLRCFVFRK